MSEARPRSYLQLIRFPLIFTMWSDALMGYSLVAMHMGYVLSPARVAMMLGVTTFVTIGGMTLCDCFEYESAKEHGRLRTLPVGVMSVHGAFGIGFFLMLLGVAGATLVSAAAGIASVVAALVFLTFAWWTRGLPFLGSVTTGLLGSAYVVLGVAFAHGGGPLMPSVEYWGPVAAIFGYVFLVTALASEEDHPRRERLIRLTGGVIVLLVVFNVLLYVATFAALVPLTDCLFVSVFVAGTVLRIVLLARRAVRELRTESVQKLVVAGFVGTIVLNANFVAFAGRLVPTLGVLFLLLPTFAMLRFFHILYPGTRTAMD
jgi:4-hydroxybenzoate polyprenyltransferase